MLFSRSSACNSVAPTLLRLSLVAVSTNFVVILRPVLTVVVLAPLFGSQLEVVVRVGGHYPADTNVARVEMGSPLSMRVGLRELDIPRFGRAPRTHFLNGGDNSFSQPLTFNHSTIRLYGAGHVQYR